MAEAEKREVTRKEYYDELSALGVKGAKRKRLRSEYMSLMGRISGIAREQRTLIARVPFVGIITRVIIGERIRELDRDRQHILTQMRHIRTTEFPALQEEIGRELREFRTKKRPPPPPPPLLLHRIKIRLYNMDRAPTPTGMFQGWFDIDALIDPETELVDWDWWLTKEEINIAKYHFVGYFKGMAKWRHPDQVTLAYFDEPQGVPYEEEITTYKRTKAGTLYTKNVPSAFVHRAEALTVGELIIGESSKEPEPIPASSVTSKEMGVFCQRFMIIDKDGVIKWDEVRNKWVYHPSEDVIRRVREELKI